MRAFLYYICVKIFVYESNYSVNCLHKSTTADCHLVQLLKCHFSFFHIFLLTCITSVNFAIHCFSLVRFILSYFGSILYFFFLESLITNDLDRVRRFFLVQSWKLQGECDLFLIYLFDAFSFEFRRMLCFGIVCNSNELQQLNRKRIWRKSGLICYLNTLFNFSS